MSGTRRVTETVVLGNLGWPPLENDSALRVKFVLGGLNDLTDARLGKTLREFLLISIEICDPGAGKEKRDKLLSFHLAGRMPKRRQTPLWRCAQRMEGFP